MFRSYPTAREALSPPSSWELLPQGCLVSRLLSRSEGVVPGRNEPPATLLGPEPRDIVHKVLLLTEQTL